MVKRYDGTRFMTVQEVDEEFLGQCVLLDSPSAAGAGYLIASADGEDAFLEMQEIKMSEFSGRGSIVTGSKIRGEMVLGHYY